MHWVCLLGMLLLATTVPAATQQDSATTIDSLFTKLVTGDSPGLAVGVLCDGHLIFARGYGFADLKTKAPITSATDFRLASVSKQFTAMSIMLLVHAGKLSYDDTLTRFFPGFPNYGKTITIRNLLNHTSGVKDYEDVYEQQMAGTPPDKIPQLHDQDVLRLLEEQDSGAFAPGTRWRYSNSGYAMLAMVVERISGQRYEDSLQHRIFAPLGMAHTLAYVQGRHEVPNRAFGYRHASDGATWQFADQSSTSAVLGDGGIYSSIEDLAKWDRALTTNALLSKKDMEPAFTPVQVPGGVNLPNGAASDYGFGWFLDTYKGHRRMWHYGDTSGFHTAIQRFPEDHITVIVLANRTDVDAGDLALRVADLYLTSIKRAAQ
jgi:CubicO group peptidase (beta-lactamase class C family)